MLSIFGCSFYSLYYSVDGSACRILGVSGNYWQGIIWIIVLFYD